MSEYYGILDYYVKFNNLILSDIILFVFFIINISISTVKITHISPQHLHPDSTAVSTQATEIWNWYHQAGAAV